MLKINDVEYKNIERFIDFNPYEGKVDGKKRKGKALHITCKTNNFKLSIETLYDLEWIKELKIQDEKDISKYISGLSYEDENDWYYLTNKCHCTLCRINTNSFRICLDGLFEDWGRVFNIKYDDIFKINN